MIIIIQILGAAIIAAGLVLTVKPEFILSFMQANVAKPWLHVVAIVVRVLLGALLLTVADDSRFPLTITIFGWIAIIAAVFLIIIGRNGFSRLVTFVLRLVKPWARGAGVVSILFGAFLIFAFI